MVQNQIKSCWERFVGQGIPVEGIRPEIIASWERCRRRGLDPFQEVRWTQLQGRELKERLEASASVVRVSRPFLEKISGFCDPDGAAFFCDPEGCIVAATGDLNRLSPPETALTVGTQWREEELGTNAISLAIAEKSPSLVTGTEHYLNMMQGLSCAAAPLFDPEGELIGVLGMAGYQRTLCFHTLAMLIALTAAVQMELKLEQTWDRLVSVLQSISEGLIFIDNKGIVSQMNTVAGRIFGLDPVECLGKPVEEVFCNSFPLLRMIKTGREGFNDRELAVDFQGRRLRLTVSSQPVCSKRGGVIGVVLTCREMKSVQRLVTRMAGAQARFEFEDLIGEDPKFTESIGIAKRVARTDSTLLIMGESGTGKDLFAQAIHNASPRRDGPFVAINCAALPRDLVESELFGYEEGAFTGAKRGGRPGKFELASGGTLFLDEIGDIPLETQASLLRVLEEKQVIRIGGHTPVPIQVRFIAATNKDIAKLVNEGHFRLDLFHRLSVVNLFIPPLRERGDDVLLLARYFLRRVSGQLGYEQVVMNPSIKQVLLEYHWPGNVRELQNAIEQALHLAEDGTLQLEHFPARICVPRSHSMRPAMAEKGHSLAEVERMAIVQALEVYQGNVSKVAAFLGIGRTTLYRKLKRYAIELKTFREDAS